MTESPLELIESEDRGDGRSRVHSIRVEIRALASLVVQRDTDGRYYATFTRAGNLYPETGIGCDGVGDSVDDAVAVALSGSGLSVPTPE